MTDVSMILSKFGIGSRYLPNPENRGRQNHPRKNVPGKFVESSLTQLRIVEF